MSTTRKILTVVLLVLSLCSISMYTIGPAEAATSDDPAVVLAPAPTSPSVAAPTLKKTHRPGYLKACEPTRAHHGRKIYLPYGSFKRTLTDGYLVLRPGHCKVFRVHRVYGAKHRLDWAALRLNSTVPFAAGHVWHVQA